MGACCDDCAKSGGCCGGGKKSGKDSGHGHSHGHSHKPAAPARKNPDVSRSPAAPLRANPDVAHTRGTRTKTRTPAKRSGTTHKPVQTLAVVPKQHHPLHQPNVPGRALMHPSIPMPNAAPRGWASGQLVRFAPNPASLRLYQAAPQPGMEGVVVSFRGQTTQAYPAGGLVFVRFLDGLVYSIAPGDLQKIKPRTTKFELARKNPDGSPITPKRVGVAAAGVALGGLLGWGIVKLVKR